MILTVTGHGATSRLPEELHKLSLGLFKLYESFKSSRPELVRISQDFEGLISSGEMLLVLGRPGSGCTKLLRTLAGYTHDLYIGNESCVNYQGALDVDGILLADM